MAKVVEKEPLTVLHGRPDTDSEKSELHRRLSAEYNEEWTLCGMDFWYWLKFVKTEDEDKGEIREFPTNFDSLQRLDYEIERYQRVVLRKSRRVLASWLGMLRQLHSAMFAGTGLPETYDAFRGGVMSIGETEAQYLIERITKVWHRLPQWQKARNRLMTDNQLFMRWDKGGTVQAFPMKRIGPQTFGFTRVFFDEMAWQEAVRGTWKGMIPTLGDRGKLLAVSTPNGKLNLFYDVWSNKKSQYANIKRIDVAWDGTLTVDDSGNISTYKPKQAIHDDKWFKNICIGLTRQEIAQMFERSFAVYTGSSVWPEFERQTHCVSETEVILPRPMLIGWDFGYHYPATTFWQYNGQDQYVGHLEHEDFDIEFGRYCKNVLEVAHSLYGSYREKMREIHFVPPDGRIRYHSRAKSGATCDIDEIKNVFGRDAQIRFGALEVGTRNVEGPRLKAVRSLWGLRADKRPGIVINEKRMPTFVEGCLGGYCYDEKGGEQPLKNEASHLQDSFQMVATGRAAMYSTQSDKKPGSDRKPHRIGHRTGL